MLITCSQSLMGMLDWIRTQFHGCSSLDESLSPYPILYWLCDYDFCYRLSRSLVYLRMSDCGGDAKLLIFVGMGNYRCSNCPKK